MSLDPNLNSLDPNLNPTTIKPPSHEVPANQTARYHQFSNQNPTTQQPETQTQNPFLKTRPINSATQNSTQQQLIHHCRNNNHQQPLPRPSLLRPTTMLLEPTPKYTHIETHPSLERGRLDRKGGDGARSREVEMEWLSGMREKDE